MGFRGTGEEAAGDAVTAATEIQTPAVERAIAKDLVRRGAVLAPAVVIICALGFGRDGALTAGYAVAIVLINLVASAAMLAWAAPKGPTVLMATALGGFLGRMILVGLAVWAVNEASWVQMKLLAVTVLLTHLGLLAWETRFVSASLAYPALKPTGEK
jgi:hypothetical protein